MLSFQGTRRVHRSLAAHGATHLVTHLELRVQSEETEPPIAGRFPGLLGLACSSREIATLLRGEHPILRSLVLRGPVNTQTLFGVLQRAPNLRHLGVHGHRWTDDDLVLFLDDDRLRRFESIELCGGSSASTFPFELVAARKRAWSHLKFLGLPGHAVASDTRKLFADDPQVVFVGHDRRQVIALDLETHGWPDSSR
ncbi:MAG: hypothetical protein AB8H86_33920 [Polyangiales bacterium]